MIKFTLPSFACLIVLATSSLLVAAAPRPPINDAPPAHERQRGCGVKISEDRVRENERSFQAHRLAPETEDAKAVIDVNFHVVYANKTAEGGWVTTSQIFEQVKVLNEGYKDSGLTWKLVNVTRTQNEKWFNTLHDDGAEDKEMKQIHRQGGPATLNVYTVGFNEGPSQSLLGYATFPMDYASNSTRDGVVLLHSTLPNSKANHKYNKGNTLVHEVGHWLGLYHTFQGGCGGSGDEVDDTPAQESPAYGCPKGRDTCPGAGVDPITNFMDYTDDACMVGFTKGQIKRMRAQLRTYREVKFTVPEKQEE